jgi:phage gpG-like protein
MGEFTDMLTAAQLTAAADSIRFDYQITSFEFKPSLGIVAKDLQQLGDDFQDMSEPLRRGVKDVMTISILENFMSGGRPSWDELSEATIQKREKEGSGTMVLVRSGSLADVASSEGIWSIGKFSATIRDLPGKVWYGKIHQAGLAGNSFGGGKWFGKYKSAAQKALGPEASGKEVDELAFKIFDQRAAKHGPAPRGQADIPARPFAVFQDEDVDAIQLIFIEWIETRFAMRGFS